jgi:hypothetical protein
MLPQLLSAVTAAATIHGFRQALEQTAANHRQQAAAWRAEAAAKTAHGPVEYLRLVAHRAEVNRWAAKLEQIATALEAEAKKREREELTHQHGAAALMTSVEQQIAAGPKSNLARALDALRGR